VQTANFRDQVVYGLAHKAGHDPLVDLSTDLAAAYVSFINAWVRRLYPNYDWPEWTVIERRTPVGHYVDFAQAGETVIGRVLKVYLADPDITVSGSLDTSFKLHANGIHCGFEHAADRVWIKFVPAAPEFTSSPWSSTTSYAKGQLTYSPTVGDCFKSKTDANLAHQPPDPAYWDPVLFPLELVEPVVRGAYSDALREDGQHDKAQVEEQAALAEPNFKRSAILNAPYDMMTDQSRAATRYDTPPVVGKGS